MSFLIFKFPYTTPRQVFGKVTRILGLSFTWQTLRPLQILTLFFVLAKPPLVGQGLLITEASRSHLDTLHVLRLLCTSDQPETQTST